METTLNPSVRLYALIRAKSDETTANEAISILEEVVKEKVIAETKELATKSDLHEGLASLELKLTEKIADYKADIIKWMFIFWLGQVAVLSGIIFAFRKLYFRQ
jgi:hypothetical protein